MALAPWNANRHKVSLLERRTGVERQIVGLLPVRHLFVMPLEQVVAKIVFQIAPDGVDVVRVVLRVVVFEEERRALHAVVVALTPFFTARPSERDFFPASLFDLRPLGIRELSA